MRILISTLALAATLLLAPFAQAAELVMVEQTGCYWCETWDEEIAPIWPKTAEGKFAPLRRVNIADLPDDIEFRSRPSFTPTFVLVEDGKELGRLEGYPGEDFFWALIDQVLALHPDWRDPQS